MVRVNRASAKRRRGGRTAGHALGPDDDGAGDGGLGQRQRAVVLGEDGALAHAVARELERVVVADALGADAVERRRRVEEAHADAHLEQAREHGVDVRHLDVAAVERLLCVGRHEPAAVDVRAGAEDHGNRLLGRLGVMVAVEHVAVGVAVARHVAVKLPALAQQRAQQPVVGAARHAVDGVVAWGGKRGRARRR